jgi:hypothetical protein
MCIARDRTGNERGMTDEEQLTEEARRSREETEKLREESQKEPWAKTSSGDADSVTDDDS